MKLWVVGLVTKFIEGERSGVWEFIGVFDSEEKAKAACKTSNCFVGPATLNEEITEELVEWPGAYYPIKEAEANEN